MQDIIFKPDFKNLSLIDLIKTHQATLSKAQANFEHIHKGKEILIIDSSFNYPGQLINDGLKKLKEDGNLNIAELYETHLIKNTKNITTSDIFHEFLGRNLSIDVHNIMDDFNKIDFTKYSMFLFTGSPSCIARGLNSPNSTALPESKIKDIDVLNNSLQIYKTIQNLNLPAIGICYGHQLISYANGGEIAPVENYQRGINNMVYTNNYEEELLNELYNQKEYQEYDFGYVPVFHCEYVKNIFKHSIKILGSSDLDIIYALLHSNHIKFTNNVQKDLKEIKKTFTNKKHLALTMQCHPEYNYVEKLITYSFLRKFKDNEKFIDPCSSANMLNLISDFLDRYYN